MSNPFVGQLKMFAGNFEPTGWMFCAGQLLPISENDVLFQLIGTTYGGDGQSTFALPDLRGSAPIHQGTSSQGTTFTIGQKGGTENITLTTNQIPAHNHTLEASNNKGTSPDPTGNSPAVDASSIPNYVDNTNNLVNINSTALANSGGSQPHDNMQPYLAISFIISLFGIFPTQS
jgi:microcystin-dependent protein